MMMAFTNLKVDTHNTERLDASLQAMLQPLSQKERTELMESLFLVSYIGAGHTQNIWDDTPEGKIKYLDIRVSKSAQSYINDRRMDHHIEVVNGYGRVKGWKRKQSLYKFIDVYGEYVDGKSGYELLAEARAIKARRGTETTAANSAFTAEKIRIVKNDILKWEAEAPRMRALMKPERRPARGGKAITPCDASIAHAKLFLRELQAGGITQSNIRGVEKEYRLYKQGEGNCMALRKIEAQATAMPPQTYQLTHDLFYKRIQNVPLYIVKPGDPILTVLSDTVRNQPAMPAPLPHDNTAQLNNALNYINLVEMTNFKVTHSSSGDIISANIQVKIHNLNGKDIQRIKYAIAIAPKAQPDALVSFDATAPSWKEQAPLKGDVIRSSGQIKKTAPAGVTVPENQSDYIFTPYVNSIKYMDGTREVFVNRFSEIEPLIVQKTK